MRGQRPVQAVAVYVALVALMLRALVPVGWMSANGASPHAALVPCPMMDGMRGMPAPSEPAKHQVPAKHQLPASHEGSVCPFATPAQPIRVVEPHQIELALPRFALFAPANSAVASGWDHVPRAPPPIV